MKIGGIILARLDSARLPRKQLRLVRERPVLAWLLERVGWIRGLDEVVLATSDRAVDDDLEGFASTHGIRCFRGSASDVAGRFLSCAESLGFAGALRVNGDSPLLDAPWCSDAIATFRSGDWDLVTNVLVRTFPIGNSIEVVSTRALKVANKDMLSSLDREHVTRFFYEQASRFRISAFENPAGSYGEITLAIDTPEDLMRYEWMMSEVHGRHEYLTGARVLELALRYEAGHLSRARTSTSTQG